MLEALSGNGDAPAWGTSMMMNDDALNLVVDHAGEF